MELNDILYGTIHYNLLAQDPQSTLNKVYAILVQEERLRTVTCVTEEYGETMTFAVHSIHAKTFRRTLECNSMCCSMSQVKSLSRYSSPS